MSTPANALPALARADRALYLGSLHFKATKREIEMTARDLLPRKDDCAFRWPAMAGRDGNHAGWCIVEFPDRGAADGARDLWRPLKIKGRPVSVGRAQANVGIRTMAEQTANNRC
jgi:hypothetical protein